ncbi:beta-propeller fold lactonase family protein [Pectobacterium polaris]|uniref:beta-propeller fold lactonase family protein n=1 Tax=Pectobacterium polaris TaxID=2042057 RepID=UPI001CF45902|nr:beta-propeller fold lactonase family protein [Pectobacterium polaris]MCA6939718.1 beta-propeller fold lactonase family protein [Pectobacterium polaris]MCA6955715.1 beta-propeller fold lactonase family protein [Pectobacterium polaris]
MTFSRSKSGSGLTRTPRQAWVLEPRMMFDAAVVATAADVAVAVAATDTAPGVDATPVKATVKITDTSDSFQPVDLFSDVRVSADKDGQTLKDLVITVNRTGANQALVIDGKSIALESGSGTTRADSDGFSYSVVVSGDTTTVTVNIDGFTDNLADTTALIDGIAYQPLGNTVAGGDVVVTLKSLSDEGGDDTDTADLNIHSTVTIDSSVNVAPELFGGTLQEAESFAAGSLAGSTGIAYSADGKYLYAAGSANTLSVFSVDALGRLTPQQSVVVENLGTVNHLIASADGKSVYTISGNGNLMQLSVNSEGVLTHTATVSVGADSTGGLAISDDGTQVYVDASGSLGREALVYNRSDDGVLTRAQSLASHRNSIIATSGDYVYIVNSGARSFDQHELKIYQRTDTGVLTLIDSALLKNIGFTAIDYAITASKDGKFVYLGDPTANTISIYQIGDNGKPSLINTVSSGSVGSLALDTDKALLYAVTTDGTINTYAVATNGNLTLTGSATGSTNGGDIALSADGNSIVTSGNGLNRYTSIQTQIRGTETAITSGLTFSDANFDRLSSGSGDYGTAQLVLSRDGGASSEDIFSFQSENNLRLDNGQIFQGDRAVATFSQTGGVLTIAFLPGVSRNDANTVLRQITYQNTGTVADGTVVRLALQANDGKADSQRVSLDVLITTNTAPVLTATVAPLPVYDTSATAVNVFTQSQIATGEAGQTILDVTLNIGGLAQAANEFLIVDGTRVDLTQAGNGETNSGYTYTYTLNDGSGTLTIHSSTGMNAGAVQALVNGIAYVNDTPEATVGTRTVTLASLRDNGGAQGEGRDTGNPDITATIQLAINNAPVIQADIDIDPALYYADGLLTGYNSSVSSIVLSDDGRSLLVIGTTSTNYGGDARVSVYQRDPDTGKLTLLQRLASGQDDGDASNGLEISGLVGRAAIFSADGSTVYLSADSAVLVFTKDATNNTLSLSERVEGPSGNVLKMARSDDGKSLYVLTVSGLHHYAIGDDGALGDASVFTEVDGTTPIGIAVNASGTVYVLGSTGRITIYTTDESGALNYAGQLVRDGVTLTYTDNMDGQKDAGTLESSNELNHANSSFTVTDEGYLYIVTSNVGNRLTVLHHDLAENTISRVEALSFVNNSPWGVTASSDGKTLYVGSNSGAVSVYAIGADGMLAQTGTLAVGRPITTLTFSEDGKSLYTGARFFNTGVMMSSAAAHAAYSQVVAMPFTTSITLSDQDLDVADDYKGVTIAISRNSEVSANDHFAFQNGSGLTLSGSEIQYQGATIATFNVNQGAVTIVFTDSVTKAVVNQVLHQVTYRNEGDTAGAAISLKIGFSDGSKDTSQLLMMVPNKAPVVDNAGYTPPPATAGIAYTVTLPENLFRDPENGALTWDVSGLPAELTFDPDTRTISGTPALNGSGTLTISVTASDALDEQTEHTLTLTIVPNPEQVPAIGGESSALTNEDVLEWINAPDTSINILSGTKDTALSADGKTLYVVSSPNSGSAVLSVFVRNAEGKFDLSKTFFNYREEFNYDTLEFDRFDDNPSLAGASEVSLSADGQYLYVVGSEVNTVTLFRVGSDGELTQAGVLDQAALGGRSLDIRSHIVSQGDYLYLTAAQPDSDTEDARSVLVFKRGTDGLLTAVSLANNLTGASSLVVDPTGRYLFVSGSGGTVGVTAFSIDAQGALAQVSQISAEGDDLYYINSLALSPDGKTLYAIHGEPGKYTLNTIAVGANGALALASTEPFVFTDDRSDSGEPLATDLIVSADGTALFVIGRNITVFSRAEDGSLTLKQTIQSGDIGIGFSGLQSVELSADGKQLYLVGSDQVRILNVGTTGAVYTEGNDPVVLLPSGRLSDPQFDALNEARGDYNGATITVGRENGGRPEDVFGLTADNGLTLDGNNILKDGVAIATFTQVDGALTVKFIAAVTQADAQNVLRQITYQNTSQDPELAGSSPTFTFSISDNDNNVADLDITVNLVGVNDPSTLTTTVLNPQIPGNGEFVKLFKDTQIDTIESGQTIWQVVLTFDVSGPNETISVDGSTIVLEPSRGTPHTAGGLQYSVTVQDGKATVLLYVARDGSGTAEIIDSIGYNYLGNNPTGERHVTLKIVENNYNGTAPETTLDQAITLTLVPAAETNTAPVITVPGATPTYTERADPIVLAPDATVSDSQMDKLNGGNGNYDGATLKITLGDGKTALDKLGFSAENGLTLSGNTLQKDGVTIGQVSNQDGVLTIRFNANAGTIPTTEDVQNTLRQITYASDSRTPAAQVAVTVTLSDRYLESQVTALSVAITAINDTPVVANDPVLSADELRLVNTYTAISGLGTVTAAARTTDGLALYVSDDKGAIALFQRDANSGELTYVRTFAAAEGVTGISQLQVSAEGSSVYALGNGNNAIIWFSRDTEGNLTHKETLSEGETNRFEGSLWNSVDITLSEDGKTLYLINGYNIVWFNRDVATGQLSYVGNVPGDMWSEPYLWQPSEIVSRGNLIFVTTNASDGSSLIVYSRDDNGKPALLGHVRDFTDATGNAVQLSGLEQITVSADGRSIFVANAEHIDAFSLDTATGTFTHLARIAAEGTVSDIALSADARVLYVTQSDGALVRYVLNDQTLTKLDTLKNAGTGFAHLLPVDGGLIALGNGVSVLDESSRLPVYRVDGPAVIVAPAIVLSDAELDALNGGTGNYQGASITLQRGETASAGDRFDFTTGNGFTLANGVISKDGQAVATFTQADGKLTVTFTAAISRADATALARQISWATSAPLTGDSASLTLVLSDGAADSAAQALGVTLSREVNLPPVGHAEQFTPPTAQAGALWSYTLPGTLFTDPENNALTFTVDGAQLPEGVRFDSATRTFSGTPSAAGLFNLTITATDSAGNATAMNVALTVNAASTPIDPGTPDPGTPTEPVNPDNTATAAPVILVQQGVSLPVDSGEREREQPLGAIVADLSRPDVQPLPNNIVTEPVRQRDAGTTRQSDAPWVLDPVMSSLMPTLEQVNFSSRAEASMRDNTALRPADSNLFLSVRGQTTALESAFSSVQGALQPDSSGALAFSLPQRMFSVREGNVTLTLQLANGRPLPAWVQFDARNGVVRITDASAVQVNQIQLALKAQVADGTSRIVPITLQTGQGDGAEMATDRGAMQLPAHSDALSAENRDAERLAPAGKTAFTEQLRQHQPEQDALLAALSELSSLRA